MVRKEEATSTTIASSDEETTTTSGILKSDSVLPQVSKLSSPHHAALKLFLPPACFLLLFICSLAFHKEEENSSFTPPFYNFLMPKQKEHAYPKESSAPPMDDSVKLLYSALTRATLLGGQFPQVNSDTVTQNGDNRNWSSMKFPTDLSPAERRAWEEKHPCTSRRELKQLYKERGRTKDLVQTPPHLELLLHEYEKLHRTCIKKSGNLTNLFLSRTSNGCKFLVGEAGNGIGNRILWMTSTLMYAILTQRVILVDPRSLVPALMCEPFPGSSWMAPSDFPAADLRPDLWTSTENFMKGVDNAKRSATPANNNSSTVSVFAARGDDTWGPASRFYCTTEQQLFQEVPWLTLGGCLYFLPELFAVPTFRPIMESLFKNRIPLTHLLRYGMLPVDSIWAKVKRVRQTYFSNAYRLVGVHLRYRDGYADYLAKNTVVNHNVLRCALENDILPNHTSSSMGIFDGGDEGDSELPGTAGGGRGKRVMVFIASLYGGLYDFLGIRYPEEATVTGEVVGLVQLSREGAQLSGLNIDATALVEVMCLSLCDTLLTSPMSTYSELAQAYGGLTPWIVHFEHGPGPGCTRGQSMDGCYQGGASTYTCPYDPDLDGKFVVKLVRSLKPCQDASGLQLVH